MVADAISARGAGVALGPVAGERPEALPSQPGAGVAVQEGTESLVPRRSCSSSRSEVFVPEPGAGVGRHRRARRHGERPLCRVLGLFPCAVSGISASYCSESMLLAFAGALRDDFYLLEYNL